MFRRGFLTCVVSCLFASSVHAYGPNVIISNGSGIVTWGSSPVVINVESDQLKECNGGDLNFSDHIATAAAAWSSVAQADLDVTIESLGVAVDEDNFCDYLFDQSACAGGGNANGPNEGGYNPVIFDENGEITDLFFGTGAKRNTLGFAGIVLREEGTLNAAKGEGVINLFCVGNCASNTCTSTFDSNDVLAFVTHELGHFFGLNHTQVNLDADDETHKPTMDAVFNPNSAADITNLETDDKRGIAYLYPKNPDLLNTQFCTVRGTLIDEQGDEFQCANVLIRNTDQALELSDAISFVSGGELPGGTSLSGRGDFTIMGLTPGESYELIVLPISTDSPMNTAASGIIPCNGFSMNATNPEPPTFDAAIFGQTITCNVAGQTFNVGDLALTNTSENVGGGSGNGGGSGGGCSLVR